MNRLFIFQHGWGYSSSFWQNLAPYFKEEQCIFLDQGYFGNGFSFENSLKKYSYIAIGHSLGFTKLLDMKVKFDYLIGLNSFTNFFGNDPKIRSIREKEFNIMNQNLIKNFSATLHNFYKRCNMPIDHQYSNMNKDLLWRDFHLLPIKFSLSKKIPTLIINSKDDIIVPEHVSLDNFSKQKNISLELLNYGNHGLGYFQPKLMYDKIMSFVGDNF